jgi:formate transporter
VPAVQQSRITAFVAAGFEHSIANMYFIPMGMLLQGEGGPITWTGFSSGISFL